jgi:hypothetical protein
MRTEKCGEIPLRQVGAVNGVDAALWVSLTGNRRKSWAPNQARRDDESIGHDPLGGRMLQPAQYALAFDNLLHRVPLLLVGAYAR